MDGKKILVVEDEFALANELAAHFRSLGAEILGPVASVTAASGFVDIADGAVLDIDLNGELVFPLADQLAKRGVPFVFFSGQDEIRLPERFRFSPSLNKPANVRAAAALLARSSPLPAADRTTDILRLLPSLRLTARLHVGDAKAADRLVERTLEVAIDEIASSREDVPHAQWLHGLMQRILSTQRARIMN